MYRTQDVSGYEILAISCAASGLNSRRWMATNWTTGVEGTVAGTVEGLVVDGWDAGVEE